MLSQMFVDDVHRKALLLTIVSGLGKGAIFTLIPLLLLPDPQRIVFGTLVALSLALFIEYSWYYSPNMKAHSLMMVKLGSKYRQDLNQVIERDGLLKMLHLKWFVDHAKGEGVKHTALDDF